MKLRVNENDYDFSLKSEGTKMKIIKSWHEKGETKIECMCIEKRKEHPTMHPRRTVSKNKKVAYSLVNNRKSNTFHHHSCPNNKLNLDYMKSKGIIKHGGLLKVNKINTKGEDLLAFFLVLLQTNECGLDVYKNDQNRNVSGRIYKAASKCQVNGSMLMDDRKIDIQVIRKNNKKKVQVLNSINSPKLIIGWGERDIKVKSHDKYDFLCKIPLNSVDNIKEYVCDVTVKRTRLETVLEENRSKVKQGWWLIWRDHNEKGKLEDKVVIFIPAESITRMPVNSIYEEFLIKELIKNERDFQKPLLWNIFSYDTVLNPSVFLIDSEKYMAIEIANTINELYLMNQKEKVYKKVGFGFTEWRAYDESHKITSLMLGRLD